MEIPGFKIERLIAEGGMSSVYLAVQDSLDRRVALKILKKFDSAEHAERFLHEGRIIASLNHRNIITIHDIGVVGDQHYIAMEYLEGGSLEERIAKGIELPDVLGLLECIGECLEFVHRKGIVHRDIKPSNILFHVDGTPKLTDFGIAKRLEHDQDLTMDGRALGSPYYLSPEQAEGRPLDGRSDIYSLGITFYQMLTGRRPYAENSHIETIVAHLTQPIPRLPHALSRYQNVLEHMLSKSANDRAASAGHLVELVRQVRCSESKAQDDMPAVQTTHSCADRRRHLPPDAPVDRRKGFPAKRIALGVVLLSIATGASLLSQDPDTLRGAAPEVMPAPSASDTIELTVTDTHEQGHLAPVLQAESPNREQPKASVQTALTGDPLQFQPYPEEPREKTVQRETERDSSLDELQLYRPATVSAGEAESEPSQDLDQWVHTGSEVPGDYQPNTSFGDSGHDDFQERIELDPVDD